MLKICPLLLPTVLLAACSLQPPADTPLPAAPQAWNNAPTEAGAPASATSAVTRPPAEDWWRALHDPAIDALVPASLQSSASLAQALARVDEARANVAVARAGSAPQGALKAAASRGTSTAFLPPVLLDQASAELDLSWEIDLFGRLRHGTAAAQAQLAALDADASLARLALAGQVADTVLLRRACMLTLARQRETLQSSETTLSLTRIKQSAGFSAPLEVARSRTSVGEAREAAAATAGECRRYGEILAALAGVDVHTVQQALADDGAQAPPELPAAPDMAPELPATVLARHPSLISAQRTADAAFEQVGQARAARLPSVNLAAVLAAGWIQVATIDQGINSWSLAPSLSLPVYDGGAGAARVAAARARYAAALAGLQQTLRDTVRDVELALVDGDTARRRQTTAEETLAAASELFAASRIAQQAGRLSLFDLEIARSSLLTAQTKLIAARRDTARGWVALVKATGNAAGAETGR